MRSTLTRAARRGAVAAALLAATAAPAVAGASAAAPGSAGSSARAAQVASVRVHRGGPDATVAFHRGRAGEVFLDATVSARGVSWADRGNESAVVSAFVDGHYATDIVITSSGRVTRQFALGHLSAGRHTLRLHYAAHRSRSDAGAARLEDLRFTTLTPSSPAYVAARYAPVLFGRNVATSGGLLQNDHTDTPLVAWHQILPAAKPGHSMIEYSVAWSNEDGGTPAPALMAQWGRTTDIEWIYRVEVDAHGRRVPGSGVFQGPNHATSAFHGVYDGTHPLLQTCTSNNNVCDRPTLKALPEAQDPMRFALSTRDVLAADQPREHEMDLHPWTYQVMAREMLREHDVTDPASDPSLPGLADQRTYLYLALDQAPADASVGLAVDVVLKSGPTTYTSDHGGLPSLFTVHRRGPVATTVKLPAGTTAADIASISVRRVAPLLPTGTDSGASVGVSAINRAFFLGSNYLPRPSFAQGSLAITLTTASPTAVIWTPSP